MFSSSGRYVISQNDDIKPCVELSLTANWNHSPKSNIRGWETGGRLDKRWSQSQQLLDRLLCNFIQAFIIYKNDSTILACHCQLVPLPLVSRKNKTAHSNAKEDSWLVMIDGWKSKIHYTQHTGTHLQKMKTCICFYNSIFLQGNLWRKWFDFAPHCLSMLSILPLWIFEQVWGSAWWWLGRRQAQWCSAKWKGGKLWYSVSDYHNVIIIISSSNTEQTSQRYFKMTA